MEAGHFETTKAKRLNDPARIEELKPIRLLREVVGVAAGMTAVEIGSGTGVFTLPMVELVGQEGQVYAVDHSPEMIEYLRARVNGSNLKLLQAEAVATSLESRIADLCVLALILHEVNSPELLVSEACRILKPGGKLVIVEWKMDIVPGPPRNVRISRERVNQLFTEAGIAFAEYIDWSPNHYVVIGKKPLTT